MRYTCCGFILLLMLTGCNPGPDGIAATDSAYKTVVPETPFINAEEYVGTLPCPDCEGIDVSLQLNRNKTYIMNSVYRLSSRDSSTRRVKDTGTWSEGNDTVYLNDSRTGVVRYIKTGTTLIRLDGGGKPLTGPLAESYVLHKK